MNVPSLDLKAQYLTIRDEMDKKILEVLGSQGFVLGPEVESLEKELAALGRKLQERGCLMLREVA